MKEEGGEKDAQDGNEYRLGEEEIRNHDVKGGEKCLIGDEVIWMEDKNVFAVYIMYEKKRHSIKKSMVRETQGVNENMQVIEELEADCLEREERSSEQIQGKSQ